MKLREKTEKEKKRRYSEREERRNGTEGEKYETKRIKASIKEEK